LRGCSITASARWSRSIFYGPLTRSACCRACAACSRARLEKEEVNILRGILARIDERLQRGQQAD
jgi:tRNA C32,U32 (ribose-2'-O)-methylase TrmJ